MTHIWLTVAITIIFVAAMGTYQMDEHYEPLICVTGPVIGPLI